MGRVMAIDIGASSYRVIEGIYSDGNLSMKTLARFRHTPIWKEGHYRWNVYEMRDNLVEALQLAAESGEPIKSVGIDTFGTDFGLLDSEGRLLEEPLAYRDSISDGISARFFTDTYGLYGKVGGTFETTSTAHILKGRSLKEGARFACAAGALNAQMLGGHIGIVSETQVETFMKNTMQRRVCRE